MTPNDAMRNADQGMVARGDDKTLLDCVRKFPLPPDLARIASLPPEIPAQPIAEEGDGA